MRTVSFLSFKVYSAAFYANDVVLKRLGSLPGWAGFAPENLAGAEGEKYVQALLDAPTAVAVRIGEWRAKLRYQAAGSRQQAAVDFGSADN